MRIYEEEEEEGPWEVIKRRRWKIRFPPPCYSTKINKVKKKSWESLPSTALLNIFCKSELKDRLKSIPLVCKSWKYVVIDDPRCWYSMIPDSVSPEDAFIKNTSGYKFDSYELINLLSPNESFNLYKSYSSKLAKRRDYDLLIGISRLFKEEGDHDEVEEEEEIEEVPVGLKLLRTLIKKSGGGAAITTLYLQPFSSFSKMCSEWFSNWLLEMMLGLIANCCPNLKHISFETFYEEEHLLQFFNKCKNLELVDLSYSEFDDAPLVIQEMGKCLPNLRGIRIRHCRFISISIATYLPQLRLLSLRFPEDLSVILFSCLELQYLYVEGPRLGYYPQDIIDQASAQVPEFYFEDYVECYTSWDNWSYGYDCLGELESTEHMLERCKETDIDNLIYILKQRKEDQYVSTVKKNDQNVSILKKKIKYYHILKKKERDQCDSRLKKKKKKYQYDSTLRKKKKDQCDYTDYVIRL